MSSDALRSPQELLDLPFAFTQIGPLSAEAFVSAARERSVDLSYGVLEALHQTRVLTPLLRVRRDNRLIQTLAKRGDSGAQHLAAQIPSSRYSLELARSTGRLYDPGNELFFSRRRLERSVNRRHYQSSEYLYSHHQLLLLPLIQKALPYLRYPRSRRPYFDVTEPWRSFWPARGSQYRGIAIALTALEPLYYARIVGSLRLPSIADFDRFDRWRKRVGLTSTMRWLGVDAAWFKDTGEFLLDEANRIDPLGGWIEVVREADADTWNRLTGLARSAIDLRIAAELVLRYYDDLAKGRRAKPIEVNSTRFRDAFHSRLTRTQNKERVLSDFGLSPHPSLILVLEGATELRIFPRVMEHFGVSRSREFIALEDAEGVDKDISPLLAYAVAPRIDATADEGYLRLTRPLTRVLFVSDPEGLMTTRDDRERRRKKWVERLARAVPAEHRTKSVLAALDRLVYVDTWSQSGLSFEFAHFSDQQIARAMGVVDRRARQPSVNERTKQVQACRRRRGNLRELMPHTSKLDLTDELWPVLERRLVRSTTKGTERRVPAVRILDRAVELASQIHGHNIVLEL